MSSKPMTQHCYPIKKRTDSRHAAQQIGLFVNIHAGNLVVKPS